MKSLEIVRKWYPHAIHSNDCFSKIAQFTTKELSITPDRILIGNSLCGDEMIHIQFPEKAKKFLGHFNLGGLCGFPFTGITGMNAFASHVPEDGATLIFYAPHIGIDQTGELGKIHRTGINGKSSCCGALNGALEKLQSNQIEPNYFSHTDYQFNVIEQILLSQRDRIRNALFPMYEATDVVYETIDKEMESLVKNTIFSCKTILLLGGIFINGDNEMGSFIEIKRFEKINVATAQRVDLTSLLV